MDKHSVDWAGPMPALVTPFHEDGAIDETRLRENVDICIDAGMTGLLVSGCTGEFWSMTPAERLETFRICVEQARGRVPVLAGTGCVRTEDVIELSLGAKDAGCDGILVMPPYFLKLSNDDIFDHYRAISDAVDLPMALYNIPGNAVNDLTPELVDRLADIRTVVALKESSGNFNQFCKTLALSGDRLRVFVGPAALFGASALLMGASGFIDTVPNLWGPGSVELYRSSVAGDAARARQLQNKSAALRELLAGRGMNYYAALKASMNMVGLPGGFSRRPLRPLSEQSTALLRDGLTRLDFTLLPSAAA